MSLDPDHAAKVQRAVEAQLPKVVPAADAARLEGLNATIGFQAARSMALSFGRAQAAAKYGAGSDQVRAYDTRIAAATATTAALRVEREKSMARAPTLGANAVGLFGRVVNPDGSGIVGATVEALDANGNRVQRTASRDGGAWQLVAQVPRAASVGTHGSTDTPPGRTTGTASGAAAPAALTVRLRAQAAGKAPVTSTETLALHAGDVVFRVLTLQPQSESTGLHTKG